MSEASFTSILTTQKVRVWRKPRRPVKTHTKRRLVLFVLCALCFVIQLSSAQLFSLSFCV